MRKIGSLILILFFFASCEKEVQWKFEISDKQIVVDGILTQIRKKHIVRITKSVNKLNEKPEPVSGAFVFISVRDNNNDETFYNLTEFAQKTGIYHTDASFRAVLNKRYQLRILYENKRYASGYVRMVPVTPFNKLTYAYNKDTSMYYIDSIAKSFDSKESAMYEIIIDWSHLPAYENVPFIEKRATLYYYTLKTIDISQVFAPEKETVYFPLGARILERKYSLAPLHAEYVRSLLSETEWRGGFFDITQANVRTNINNGGLGFFGICTTLRDTLVVE